MDIKKEREAFNAYFKEKYPELYKDVFDPDGDERAILGYSFAWSSWQAKAKAVPEGFVLVPKEPTEAMVEAGKDSSECGGWPDEIYKAMIEAQEPAND